MADTLESLRQKYERYKQKRDKYKKIRDRLGEAYDKLKAIKDDQENFKSRLEKKVTEESPDWIGNHYLMYVQCGNEAINNARAIYNNIDGILDDINCAKSDAIYQYNKFWGLCNSAWDAIQNWAN